MITVNELFFYSDKLENTMDCPSIEIFIGREFGYTQSVLTDPFVQEVKSYLESTTVREVVQHPNGYTSYEWFQR